LTAGRKSTLSHAGSTIAWAARGGACARSWSWLWRGSSWSRSGDTSRTAPSRRGWSWSRP